MRRGLKRHRYSGSTLESGPAGRASQRVDPAPIQPGVPEPGSAAGSDQGYDAWPGDRGSQDDSGSSVGPLDESVAADGPTIPDRSRRGTRTRRSTRSKRRVVVSPVCRPARPLEITSRGTDTVPNRRFHRIALANRPTSGAGVIADPHRRFCAVNLRGLLDQPHFP